MRKQHNYHQTGSKSANFKEAHKAHKRREDKIARVCTENIQHMIIEQKVEAKQMWAPVDKIDAKHRLKVR